MRKYLIGAVGALIGVFAVREAYAKGFNKGVDECKDRLEFAISIKEKEKKDDEES